MELYLIRHGQTVWNVEGRLQGAIDTELNENGREKARELGEKLKDIDFDVIFSSPLSRAYNTAVLVRGEKNTEIIKDDRLREISFGVADGSEYKSWTANGSPYNAFFVDPAHYVPPEGGETFLEVCARTREFVVEKIEPLYQSCKRVMIVAHGALNSGLSCYLEGRSVEKYWGKGLQKNCAAIIYSFDGEKWEKVSDNDAIGDASDYMSDKANGSCSKG